ncbi:MAG: alpha/beta hydrolase [Boseongicola sp.]
MKNDRDYAVGEFIPNSQAYPDRWAEMARAHREAEALVARARLNTAYGSGERELFDVFHPSGRAEGLVVFVHGGYWHLFDRSFWSHFATGPTSRGWAVAIPSYPLAPEARVFEITRAIARAIETAAKLVPGPIVLTGHSAGGHLVARMGCRDVVMETDTRERLRRIVPISPVADLRPLLETSMNAVLQLDDAEARSESPALHEPPTGPVTVWVGAEERPVFLDQARWLAEAWSAEHRIAPGRHHFDVIDQLCDPDSPLVARLLG